MKKLSIKQFYCAFLLSVVSSFTQAVVIDFDDLSGDAIEQISAGYQGFNWDVIASVDKSLVPDSGFDAGVVSGSNAAYNLTALDAVISLAGEGSFDFTGAFFTAAWFGDQFHQLSFEGWLDGVLLYSTADVYALASSEPTWIQLDWAGIDQLTIYSNLAGWDYWVMDDFTATIHSASVPESSALVLMLMGLLGITLLRRRD
jgi:hypothetical protein